MGEAILYGGGGGGSEGLIVPRLRSGLDYPSDPLEGDLFVLTDKPISRITAHPSDPVSPGDYDCVIRFSNPYYVTNTKSMFESVNVFIPEVINDVKNFLGTHLELIQDHSHFYSSEILNLYIQYGGIKYYDPIDTRWYILPAYAYHNGQWVEISTDHYDMWIRYINNSHGNTIKQLNSNFEEFNDTPVGHNNTTTGASTRQYNPFENNWWALRGDGSNTNYVFKLLKYDWDGNLISEQIYDGAPFISGTFSGRYYQFKIHDKGNIVSLYHNEYIEVGSYNTYILVFNLALNKPLVRNSAYSFDSQLILHLVESGDQMFIRTSTGAMSMFQYENGLTVVLQSQFQKIDKRTGLIELNTGSMASFVDSFLTVIGEANQFYRVGTSSNNVSVEFKVYPNNIPISTTVVGNHAGSTGTFRVTQDATHIFILCYFPNAPRTISIIKVDKATMNGTKIVNNHPLLMTTDTGTNRLSLINDPNGILYAQAGSELLKFYDDGTFITRGTILPYPMSIANEQQLVLQYPTYTQDYTKW